MDICPNCGAANTEGSKFCTYCGSKMMLNDNYPQPAQQSYDYGQYNKPEDYADPIYAYGNMDYSQPPVTAGNKPEPMRTGWLMAWSIFTVLISPLAGIVAIATTASINKVATVEDQKKKKKVAIIWCIVGIALNIIVLLGRL